MVKKVGLVILDGWGLGNGSHSDAINQAITPYTDSLFARFPHATLRTDGENVGLPDGQMGNSEVGHMNIGAGRVVWQMLAKINKAFAEGSVSDNKVLLSAMNKAKAEDRPFHILGLLSDGGVHAHIEHIKQLCSIAQEFGLKKVYVHAFLDGRDTDPKSGLGHVKNLLDHIKDTPVQLSTVVGRYYAMDRDERWERVKVCYDLLTQGKGKATKDVLADIQSEYSAGITDEFMSALRCLPQSEGLIAEGDVVLNANFRTDRGRQITRALTQEDFAASGMHKLKLHYYTVTQYDVKFKISGVLFENDNLQQTLGEVISMAGKTQLRAAETEKYPHVTFFFSGGREAAFEGEDRLMANSPKVATYDLQPEMSAIELTDRAIAKMQQQQFDFVCLNFANADMVGHTGVYEAIIKAVETVDACLQRLVEVGEELGYEFLIIADHGNADFAVNDDGTPNTAHTTNPVPVWWVTQEREQDLRNGILADVAPTILQMMGLVQPLEMTGKSLIL
ncbi:MAG: 2,3-bisphosphoglycerate-independent phosphoglycerate mutase [Sphingomonadales bacterium]|nr:2,3-bisphosphoglycerate-independent phosphoglycerate mutase [Sphingomonadales bacterium]